MALTINGKKVLGYALGDTEFYSIDEHADGSISCNGEIYIFGIKTSDDIQCNWVSRTGTSPNGVSFALSQELRSDSALTLQDLINKGKKIRLTVICRNEASYSDSSLNSSIIDFSKPDSNGHFNFQWLNGVTSKNTYCYSNSSADVFTTYSDAFSAYSPDKYGYNSGSYHMQIIYSGES